MRFPAPIALLLLTPCAGAQWVLGNDPTLLGVDDGELTPDGRLLVVRENTFGNSAHVYDTRDGAELFAHESAYHGVLNGVCQDAVAVSNERAIVLGATVILIDLAGPSLLAELILGPQPRDVVMTPDGSLASVRGGDALYVIDMATGSVVFQGAGAPAEYSAAAFDVDSVVGDDRHAVFTSEVGLGGGVKKTRVTVVDLHPSGGGIPAIVFETDSLTDQFGKPHDLAMTPDGRHAAVRSDTEVGLYRLEGANSRRMWRKRLFGDPGPFGLSAMDSIEVTDLRIATLSRSSNGSTGAQLDLFDLDGRQRHARLVGDPHDLALTPDGRRLALRTHLKAYLFDVRRFPEDAVLRPVDELDFGGTHTSYGAGLDSIAATNERVAAISRSSDSTAVAVWDISADSLTAVFSGFEPDISQDVAISPDGARVLFGFWKSFLLVDLRTGVAVLRSDGTGSSGWPTWCDGAVIDGVHAAAFGTGYPNSQVGWVSLIDLFEGPQRFCPTTPNSTGAEGELIVSGTPSVAANDLSVWGVHLPGGTPALLAYGSTPIQVPFGDGFLCLGGHAARFPLRRASAVGVVAESVDYDDLPRGGGTIVPGSTWYFQMLYRDPRAGASGINLTDALGIVFGI